MENFSNWLAKATSEHEFRCEVCNKSFSSANMGIMALKSHSKRNKNHQQLINLRRETMNVKQLEHNTDESSSVSNDVVKIVVEERLPTPQPVVVNDATRKVEVLYALHLVEICSSFRNSDVSQLLKIMFPDSAIAGDYQCGKTKITRRSTQITLNANRPKLSSSLSKTILRFQSFISSRQLQESSSLILRFSNLEVLQFLVYLRLLSRF